MIDAKFIYIRATFLLFNIKNHFTVFTFRESVEVCDSLGCHLPQGSAAEPAGLGLGRARQAVRPGRGGVAHYQSVDFALPKKFEFVA